MDSFIRVARGDTGDGCHPTLFRLRDGERELLDVTCEELRVAVVDRLQDQLADWARVQAPVRPAGHPDVAARVATEMEDHAYGVWAFFPWRRTVVRILDEGRFVDVRTNRNRDKVTHDEARTLRSKRVGVVGLSVGHAAALTLAQEGVGGELRLADFDTIELSNLNRLRTSVISLGLAKSTVTARDIAELDPYVRVSVFSEGLREDNLAAFFDEGGPLDLVVEECDALDIKVRVREEARRRGIPVVMDTNDRGMLDVERFDLEPNRPVLHGLLESTPEPAAEPLVGLWAFLGGRDQASERFRASVDRIGDSLVSYPQLASEVALGAALLTTAARAILLGEDVPSGRLRCDLSRWVRTAGRGGC